MCSALLKSIPLHCSGTFDSLPHDNVFPSFRVVNLALITMFPATRSSVLRAARTQLRQSQAIAVPQYSAFARLASTFAVLEQKDGKFQPASLAAVTAGTKLGGSITAFVAGSGVKSVAEEIGKAKGIEKVIYVENGAYDKVRVAKKLA
jgi:hypothetical protein